MVSTSSVNKVNQANGSAHSKKGSHKGSPNGNANNNNNNYDYNYTDQESWKKIKHDSSAIRAFFMREWVREVSMILYVQKFRNKVLDVFFFCASILGDELFYIMFLPLCCWVFSYRLASHMSLLMSLNVGLGNIFKNILSLPRPPSPPVWLNSSRQLDHGMPSTHTMSAVSLPWYWILYHYVYFPTPNPYISLSAAIYLGIFWTISVAFSRVYNGHHSPMDIVGGAILAIFILIFYAFVFRHLLDRAISEQTILVPLLSFALGAFVLAIHPKARTPTPATAETGLVLGTGVGVIVGMWLSRTYQLPTSAWEPSLDLTPTIFHSFLRSSGLIWFVRFLIGAITVAVVRVLSKKVWLYILNKYFFTNKNEHLNGFTGETSDRPHYNEEYRSVHHPTVEIIVKYFTYIAIAFSVTTYIPIIFVILGLHTRVDYPFIDVPIHFVDKF
eukprot:TRINITY_DN4049_c0_g1_i2.p1 TRINITY_DN4049_c0_g1~~TRINITY_DN4049_c0_g1_i2.p1  ORF type:complete len:443 (+),score=56.49 TRINITY_DN4049_c0_g1_i2:293-1621(+)